MKRVLLVFLILVTARLCYAQVFYNDRTPTLAWEAVTTDTDGDPITGVTYRMHLANANTDPNKANPVMVVDEDGNDSDLTATFTIIKGRYFVGVQAVLAAGLPDELVSEINWGDIIDNQENVVLFGLRWAVPPHPPKNLNR